MKAIKFFIGLLFLGTFLTASAQDESTNKTDKSISFGVKGGLNLSTVTGDDFDSPDMRTSFHVGGLFEFPLTDMFSLQVEGLYSSQGFKTDLDVNNEDVEFQIDYINVPVLAKIYATKGLSFEVGPQFGFKVNEEIDIDPEDNPGDFETDQVEDFDFGVAGGLTFQSEMGLFATGRYVYGMTDIIEDFDAHNSVFQISLGYKF